jgi:hypothetical protein
MNAAADELSEVKQEVGLCDTFVLGRPRRRDTLFDTYRAWAYVKAAAIVEHTVRELLKAIISQVCDANVPQEQLRVSLLSLVLEPRFRSIQDKRRLQHVWETRCQMLETTISRDVAVLSADTLPLDGKTIEARHLEVIWRVFGFKGQSFPSPLHKMSLIEMAQIRNSLAHGEVSPKEIARQKPSSDVQRMLEITEDILVHLGATAESYLQLAGYHR